jgi:hypothetical protein
VDASPTPPSQNDVIQNLQIQHIGRHRRSGRSCRSYRDGVSNGYGQAHAAESPLRLQLGAEAVTGHLIGKITFISVRIKCSDGESSSAGAKPVTV